MAIIKCDACGAMLDPKGLQMRNRTEGELEIKLFICGKCGKEYISFITDGELREKIREIRRQAAKIRLMRQKKFTEKTIRKEERTLEDMRNRAYDREQELKQEYERGNFHGPEGAEKTETADQESVLSDRNCGGASGPVSGHHPGGGDDENRLEQNAGKILLLRAANAEYSERGSGGSPETDAGEGKI